MTITGALLHLEFEGNNGDTTTTDSSSYARTITRQGSATISTTQVLNGVSSSYHPGSGNDGWNVVSSSDFANIAGNNDFSMLIRIYYNSIINGPNPLLKWVQNAFSFVAFEYNDSSTLIYFTHRSGALAATTISWSWTPVINTEYRIKLTRSNNVYTLYINEAQIGIQVLESTAIDPTGAIIAVGLNVGWDAGTSNYLDAYVDEVIIYPGILSGVPINFYSRADASPINIYGRADNLPVNFYAIPKVY